MQNFILVGSEQIQIGNLLKKLKKCERGIDNFRGQIASFTYQGYKGGGRVLLDNGILLNTVISYILETHRSEFGSIPTTILENRFFSFQDIWEVSESFEIISYNSPKISVIYQRQIEPNLVQFQQQFWKI